MPFTHACDQLHIVLLQQSHDSIEKADSVSLLAWGSSRCVSANIGTFDLGQNPVQMIGGRIIQAGKIPLFQVKKIVGKAANIDCIDEETANNQYRLIVR